MKRLSAFFAAVLMLTACSKDIIETAPQEESSSASNKTSSADSTHSGLGDSI